MLELIRIILQFGLKRIIFLSRYEKLIKDKLYEKKSLRNIDLDSDGVIDGFSFKIKNPLYSAYYRKPKIEIDGEIIDDKHIIIKVDDKAINMEDWTDKNPIPLIPGEPLEIIIRKPGGLEKGKHVIRILNARIIGFDTSMDLEFIDEIR